MAHEVWDASGNDITSTMRALVGLLVLIRLVKCWAATEPDHTTVDE